jgi:hypothetical protein
MLLIRMWSIPWEPKRGCPHDRCHIHDDFPHSVALVVEQVDVFTVANEPTRAGQLLVDQYAGQFLGLLEFRHQMLTGSIPFQIPTAGPIASRPRHCAKPHSAPFGGVERLRALPGWCRKDLALAGCPFGCRCDLLGPSSVRIERLTGERPTGVVPHQDPSISTIGRCRHVKVAFAVGIEARRVHERVVGGDGPLAEVFGTDSYPARLLRFGR